MGKKEVALVYGITNNYVDKLANVLIGLNEKSKKFWDDIIILHNGLTEKNKQMLNEIVKCKFIEVKRDDFINEINEEAMNLYSIAAFFRYECFNMLNKYKKVIWSDVDVLYQGDLSGLIDYAIDKDIAAVQALEEYAVINNFYDIIEKYNMFVPMYNSGLLVLNDKLLKYGDLSEWCYKKTIEYASLLKWPDQGIINLMIQEFDMSVDNIDIDLYHCHPSFFDKGKKAKIVHAHGTRKFWNDEEYNRRYPLWNEYGKKWNLIKKSYGEMPLVSVIMTVYKRYDFLNECLNSILNQTYDNFEIILVIEKSENQDEIKEFVEKYDDDRIKIICNEKREGFPKSLNIAIENSNGKYIARMDDDDISVNIRFEEEVSFLENNLDIGMVSSNAEFFMNSTGKWFDKGLKNEEIKTELLVGCPICHPSVMFNKKLFKKYNLKYNENYFSEDFELWSQAIKYLKMERLNTVLLKYRASGLSLTGSNNNENKIANSTKNTIKHQFKENLGLDLTDNEITAIQKRKEILCCYGNTQSIIDLKKNTIKKIIDSNKVQKYYDEKLLKKVLNYNQYFEEDNQCIKKKNYVKSGVKLIIKPFYKILQKVYNKLSYSNMLSMRLYFDDMNNKINHITEMTHRLDWDINYSKKKKICKKK